MASRKYATHAKRKVYRPAIERGIPQRIVDAIVNANPIDEDLLTKEATLSADLGLDSLDLVELAMDLEASYSIVISDEVLETWVTVADVIRTVEKAAFSRAHATGIARSAGG